MHQYAHPQHLKLFPKNTSIANPGLNVNGLHEHIVKDEVVSLKFTKVPGKLVVEEAKDNIPLW